VVEPGLSQLKAALLILVATIGITFSLQARFADRLAIDRGVRLLLAAFALLALLHPNEKVAALAGVPVGLIVAYWLLRRRPLADLEGDAPAAHAAPTGKGRS
jgi:ABC-type iron transport system FetAB permease component